MGEKSLGKWMELELSQGFVLMNTKRRLVRSWRGLSFFKRKIWFERNGKEEVIKTVAEILYRLLQILTNGCNMIMQHDFYSNFYKGLVVFYFPV